MQRGSHHRHTGGGALTATVPVRKRLHPLFLWDLWDQPVHSSAQSLLGIKKNMHLSSERLSFRNASSSMKSTVFLKP